MGAARRRRFVGRADELGLFEAGLDEAPAPFHILYVHGPGGVGKTALMHAFARRCARRDVPAYYLDARTVASSSPADFTDALRRAAGRDVLSDDGAPHQSQRFVLILDTFEVLVPLERWLRRHFIPCLPSNVLLVVSGREPPPPGWRADPGVQALLRTAPLRNLSPEESRRYLAQRAVPEAQRGKVLRFAHGHPLALSLAADAFDQDPDRDFEPIPAPDLVGALLKRFLDEVPSPEHRLATAACALVRYTTEAVLAHLLDRGDAHALFEWLRSLSFVEAGPAGLFPHDAAREALVADLRWRDPEAFEALHRRARRFYSAQLRRARAAPAHSGRRFPARGALHEDILTNYLYLYRDNPVVQPYFQQLQAKWQNHGALTRDNVRDEDWPHLRAMAARYEGEEAARLLDYWKGRQPEGALVFRDGEEAPAGFVVTLRLSEATAADRARDPAVEAACAYLERRAPLRQGEDATLFRFWMDRDEHQRISPVQSLIAAYRVRYYLTAPRLAFTFIPCAEPDFWALVFAYAAMRRLPEANFETKGQRYGMFGHDWRVVPPAAWLELLAERDITLRAPEAVPAAPGATHLVLSRPDFADAVKDALRGYARPDEALHENPLLRSRLVAEAAGGAEAVAERLAALRRLVEEAAEALASAPREAKFYRALRATYLDPAPTQEQAAEVLDLPFSTFRRHLKSGVEHVTEVLWRRETDQPPG